MRIIALSALATLALTGAPAFGQTVMLNFSFPELKQQMIDLKSTIKKEAETDDKIRFIEAETEDGLIYAIYGLECDSKEPTQRCRGAEMVASFDLERDGDIGEVLDMIDYAAVADYKGTDNRLKLSRYVIFDDGNTPANFRVNITVFTNIANDVWDLLEEEGFFDK